MEQQPESDDPAPHLPMRERVAAFDWSTTPLGPAEEWPPSLRTAVDICLASRFPITMWWGPGLTGIYNDAYVPILGAKHPAALGRPAAEVWAEIWDVIGPMLAGVVAGEGSTWSHDLQLTVRRRGFSEEAYYTFSYSAVADSDGSVGGVFCAVSETTATVVGTRRLAALQQLATALSDAESVDEVCRRTVEILAGTPDIPYSSVYLRGADGALRPVAGQLPPGLDPPVEKVAASGVPLTLDAQGRPISAAATDGVCGVYVAPLPGVQAATCGVLVCGCSARLVLDGQYRAFLDTAARHLGAALAGVRQLEAERGRAQALAELDAAKTVFFSDISHELRTPLTLIAAPLADALSDAGEPPGPRTRERLELAARNADRLRALVDAMLDFARIEAGRLVPEPAALDLASATAAAASGFAPAAERAGLTLTVSTRPLRAPVVTDPDMWDRIVLNLLSNALKYTLSGGIELVLREGIGPHGDGLVELVVSDTGVGIEPEHLPHLFERFYRVRGATGRSHEGAGIGLALVAELVGLLGGTVEVDSVVGQGTTFTVRIPYGDEAAAVRVPRPGARDVATARQVAEAVSWIDDDLPAQPAGDGLPRLLVAEDNADMRAYLAQVLAGHYAVEVAADGAAALQRIRTRRPDLLLTDVMMPALDGFALLDAVRADPLTADLPVVLLSARAGTEATGEGFAAGADDYLVKPFSTDDLLARLAGNLERARARSGDGWATRTQAARRAAAAALVRGLVDEVDLDEVYPVAVRGLGEVFGGRAVLASTAYWPPAAVVTPEGSCGWYDLPADVAAAWSAARADGPAADSVPGLLVVAAAPSARHEAWVQFPQPRVVSADERLLADLLGDVLATGLDRALREGHRVRTEEGLRAAMASHRLIGQAVGVLIERHRLTDAAAFDRLREASNRRNVKLRDLAERLIRTGEEP